MRSFRSACSSSTAASTCDSVFHNSCSQRKVCCKNPVLCTEKNCNEDENLSSNIYSLYKGNHLIQNEDDIDVQKILFENNMLWKMLYEAESKHKILECNISLLQENKEEKLETLKKNRRPRKYLQWIKTMEIRKR